MIIRQVLVATDFSEAGRFAVAEATEWARQYRAGLHVLHVIPPRRWFGEIFAAADSLHEIAGEHAAAALRQITEHIDATHIPHISTGVMEGKAARVIAGAARELRADLLVIGAQGEHQRSNQPTALGGTAAKLADHPEVPLLLVRRKPEAAVPAVLAPVDLTPISSLVIQWAFHCCHGGVLRALHVYEEPLTRRLRTYGISETAISVYTEAEHAKRARRLSDLIANSNPPSSVRVAQTVERGESSEVLLDHIRGFNGNTLVLGKHRSDSERTAPNYESVCHFAARYSPTNVLIIPPMTPGSPL